MRLGGTAVDVARVEYPRNFRSITTDALYNVSHISANTAYNILIVTTQSQFTCQSFLFGMSLNQASCLI